MIVVRESASIHTITISMQKSLDQKLARIAADPSCRDFILADAKDPEMALGIAAPGVERDPKTGEPRYRTLQEFQDLAREIVRQGLVDIMLMTVSTSELLTIRERLFDDSPVTPAIRANDTTDIWLAGGTGGYSKQPALPFRTALLEHAMFGHVDAAPGEKIVGVDLGLYSVTLNNDAVRDRETLNAYREFRVEAERKHFRHFLEVFAPNACAEPLPADIPRYVNDSIARLLAGVATAGRPLFLKIPYFGPAAMEQLVAYDSSVVVGILGGSAGTTFDAFHMLWDAKRHGARAALFGRKINNAEHQLAFVQHLRALADDQMKPEEAVRSYHGELAKLKIAPHRSLAEDLQPLGRG
jgi:hypothetical protein